MKPTMRKSTDSLADVPLALLSRRERHALRLLELDWPDSLALMARAARQARSHAKEGVDSQAVALAILRAGIAAHRQSWEGRSDDTERFAAFIDGITLALPREQQHCVAKALSAAQRRVLARRLPPGGPPDVG